MEFGEYLFDQLVLFAPATERLAAGVDATAVMEFVRAGRSVVLAGASNMAEPMRELAAECGLVFDEQDSYVLDHVNFDASDADGPHTLIAADGFGLAAEAVLGTTELNPVLFRGIGHAVLGAGDDEGLVLEVLSGSAFAYSHVPSQTVETPLTVGATTALVTALQARNNARMVVSGSIELFSDAFISATVTKASGAPSGVASGNLEFALRLTAWAFQERGMLRLSNTHHYKTGDADKVQGSVYRVKDDIEFHTTIEEWTGTAWQPYTASDVQIEFQMLDPYVRLTMTHDSAGHYVGAFKVPDVYGVFQFKLTYRRHGYSSLLYAEQVVVRPFRHNEFERFITQAWPYYTSAFSMMGCFFLFSFVFLHNRD